jgi:peptidoglycan/xylan/chitin deacetylase (PgdA/CDA1 family)
MKFTAMNKIINFHLVNDSVWFEKIVCYLKSKYTFITNDVLYEFYKGQISLHNSCHITIDDGDKSFYDVIYPVLKKHNVPASIYVSPKISTLESNYWFQEVNGYNQLELKRIIANLSNISIKSLLKYNSESILKTLKIDQINEIIKIYREKTKTPKRSFQNMTVNNLKEVNKSGLVTIGAHTINHPILKNEDDMTSKYEIVESINELSSLLNFEIKYFSYPNGIPYLDFSDREKNYLQKANIHLAFTTESKNLTGSGDRTCVPRFAISDRENICFFKTKMFLGSKWEIIKRMKPSGEYRERKELIRIFSLGEG